MSYKPPTPYAPTIRRAKPDEAATLTEIAFAAKRHWGYPEQWIEGWKHILTLQPCFIADHETYMACIGDQAVGFYALRPGLNRMHLEHLWVLPVAMRRGIGQALFAHAIGRAKVLGFSRMEIESDPHAIGFYLRMGAHQTGATTTELDGSVRELPVLVFEIGNAA